jgi:hypothetical protein
VNCLVGGSNHIAFCDISGGVATTPPLTANATAGGFTVTAAATGAATQTFTLTNQPVGCVVTSVMDPAESGKVTLRDAVTIANAGSCTSNTISFDATAFPANATKAIVLNQTAGTLNLAHDMTIDGSGHHVAVDGGCTAQCGTLNAVGGVKVFGVTSGSHVTLNALTIQHGTGATGGGINSGGTLTVTNSTIVGNSAIGAGARGGGISNVAGTLTVTNSTITGNASDTGGGGGIGNTAGTLTMTNSTVVGNTTATVGGGISSTGTVTLTNTLVAGNSAAVGPDVAAAVTAGSANNLIGDGTATTGITNGVNGNRIGSRTRPINPLFGQLGDYGGPTLTLPLLPGSPAIDAGTATGAPATDQRGVSRPQGAAEDIGAFESQGFTLTK